MADEFDAVVVGSGPNGLVAALELAQAGWRVLVLERSDTLGGGARTAELTLPGFRHDVCSAIHPLGLASPALRDLGLEKVGVEWVQPDAPLAHALRPGHSVLQERSLAATAVGLGVDGRPWERLFGPSVGSGLDLVDSLLDPLDLPPRHPVQLARYGMSGLWSVSALARRRFRGDDGRSDERIGRLVPEKMNDTPTGNRTGKQQAGSMENLHNPSPSHDPTEHVPRVIQPHDTKVTTTPPRDVTRRGSNPACEMRSCPANVRASTVCAFHGSPS